MALRICTIGHADHGKTTLSSALAQGHNSSVATLDKSGLSFEATRFQYETATRQYDHVDFAAHNDTIKYFVTKGPELDAVILVVSATEGPMPQTREQVLLASQVGVPSLIVLLNKTDLVDDDEQLELVEMEVRELVSQYGFPGDDLPVVRGSALKAVEGTDKETVAALLRHLDALPQGNNARNHSGKLAVHFESLVYIRTKEEGGRHTPFFKGYRPLFNFSGKAVIGTMELPEGVDMIMPGNSTKMNVTLIEGVELTPTSTTFTIQEGSLDVGVGVVTNLD
ncbi:translation elongation factor Tu [Aphanomyces astaci]|uniref:Elongation factor Tu, chloroplastic n=1 Tax=Aphanomyces astaci TaxID=112090 RepID=W4FMV1_APHAT|nr:translation elongation factor Tu [Aphanomyces astaci]ETV68842.1 translation elongation factor Tu [Aphanomyces astaci]RHY83591.1 hypothetical protein DYB35_003884 [Aphanomyces astaci]RHZ31994.1 hypothetical protein DYB37_005209 [Aphanomyces astaci]RQM25210.1 hypothetical protein B5M09_005596 [Aphanomyces astaci]|eukprot:XP_009841796.1 translation elongation factor Tu [Aphanomyces astaci]